MSLDNRPVYSGGCQCGAVRFHVEGALGDASVCHCRMCQKASGNFYLPLVSVRGAKLTWTRGEPKRFQSSNYALARLLRRMRHAADLSRRRTAWRWRSPPSTIRRRSRRPSSGASRRSCLMSIDPGSAGRGNDGGRECNIVPRHLVSYQHPDHDTEKWPPEEKK